MEGKVPGQRLLPYPNVGHNADRHGQSSEGLLSSFRQTRDPSNLDKQNGCLALDMHRSRGIYHCLCVSPLSFES